MPSYTNLSHLVAHIDLFCIGIAVEDQLFQLLMCLHQDRSAGSLINAAGFHADNTVLYDIDDADAVLCRPACSESRMMSETFISSPFTLFGTPFSKVMVTYSAFVGSFLGSDSLEQADDP